MPQPKQFAGIHQALYEREELRFGTAEGVGVDAEEVEALVRRLFCGWPGGALVWCGVTDTAACMLSTCSLQQQRRPPACKLA